MANHAIGPYTSFLLLRNISNLIAACWDSHFCQEAGNCVDGKWFPITITDHITLKDHRDDYSFFVIYNKPLLVWLRFDLVVICRPCANIHVTAFCFSTFTPFATLDD